ncbi:AraC family transcriptional regulator [Lacrimispora xylanolytica]|jgi:hypothetical protein|uniref:AraC family transcriptional regulator n=1 Tax=Lacrimispora xylanolytica TaxID=29375 RepID=A0ABY7A8F5_9FIRM|nr:AraC family transcriptional regulator [Lacrimispora xylanolytica]MBS5955771.1 AraC family transcriptional regulator [Clostridiales bacterium]WAJ22959.1 AraC family transcriptional regulator [Lacrimispora xylanolytica]
MKFFRNHRHNVSMLLAIFVTLTLLYSSFFVLTRFRHDCPGEGCIVCLEIKTCIRTLHLLSQALGSGVILTFAIIFVKNQLKAYESGILSPRLSLVGLKVRLNR